MTADTPPCQPSVREAILKDAAMVIVEDVTVPGYTARVDAEKYRAMREAILQVTPVTPPGVTAKEMRARLAPVLPPHQ